MCSKIENFLNTDQIKILKNLLNFFIKHLGGGVKAS